MIKARPLIISSWIFVLAVLLVIGCPQALAADENSSHPGYMYNGVWHDYPPNPASSEAFGGSGNDTGSAICLTADGGFAIAGNTNSFGSGGADMYLIKTDGNGRKLWEKTYGGLADDEAFALLQAVDGGFVLAGYTRSAGSGAADVYLIKTDANGNKLWEKTYGGPADDVATALLATDDGGYLVAGYTYSSGNGGSDAYLLKTDSNGDKLWEKTYGGSADDQAYSLSRTNDGSYLLAGWSRSFSNTMDFYVALADTDGNLQWQKKYGMWDHGNESYSSWAYGAFQMVNGQYLAGGWELYPNGNRLARLLRIDSDGTMGRVTTVNASTGSTSTTYNDSSYHFGSNVTFLRSMIRTADGGYAVTGPYVNASGDRGSFVAKLYADGNYTWAKTFNVSSNDSTRGLVQTPEGDYVMTGWTENGNGGTDVLLLKLSFSPAATVPAPMTPDVVRPAAAVVVGTGLGFLGLFWARIQEVLAAIYAKLQAVLKPVTNLFNKMFPIDTLVDFVKGYVKTTAKSLIFRKESQIVEAAALKRVPFLAGFSSLELLVVLVSSLFLGLAFLVAKQTGLDAGSIVLYLVVAGLATILHDLTHRYVAFRYQVTTEYQFWPLGTLSMFITAFFLGTAYGSPARTLINDAKKLGLKEQAYIALSGPLMSFAVTVAFFLLVPLGGYLKVIGLLGVSMNLLSAVYGLMPFDPMDGKKVFGWRKAIWAVTFVPLFIAYLLAAIYLI